MNLLPRIRESNPNFSTAISWLSTSKINLCVGIVSSRRLFLFALYHLVSRRLNIAFMVTNHTSAMEEIKKHKPGILIITADLDHDDSDIAIAEEAKQIDHELCSIMIVDSSRDDLSLAFRSSANAVICEQEVFALDSPQDQLIRALALGKTYRSPQLKAYMVAQNRRRGLNLDAVMAPPCLTQREADVAALLLEGCNDRQIAAGLGMAYNTVRCHSRSLRRKFGVSHRSQLVLRLLDYGKDRLQPRSPSGVNPPPR
jgi:DNA-binding NarL/FixJ family response regulator